MFAFALPTPLICHTTYDWGCHDLHGNSLAWSRPGHGRTRNCYCVIRTDYMKNWDLLKGPCCWDPRWKQWLHSGHVIECGDSQSGKGRRAHWCSRSPLEVVWDPQSDCNASSWLAGHPVWWRGKPFWKVRAATFPLELWQEGITDHFSLWSAGFSLEPRGKDKPSVPPSLQFCETSPGVQPTMTGGLTPWQWGQYWPPSKPVMFSGAREPGHHDSGWTDQSRQVAFYLLQKGTVLHSWTPSELSCSFPPESRLSSA